MRVLVTGATGAYGAHFAKLCLDRGHDVFSIRHRQRPHDTAALLEISNRITWATGDIRDSRFLSLLLAENDIQAVAHFAAKPLVRTSTLVAEPIFSVNAGGTVALLDAVKEVAARRRVHFLMVSTDKVYGDAGDRPYVEDTPLLGSSIYEASKVAAEAACRAYRAHGLVPHLVVSRSCNVIAAADMNWRLVPNTIRQFLCDAPAKVYTRGQYVREYMHVEDAVEAQYLLMMRADEYAGQAFNIGSGEQFTQEQVIDLIRREHFPDGQVLRVEPPGHHFVEIAYQRLDTSKIQRALGWSPKRSFAQAVADVVGWWKSRRELAPWSLL
jgi:nucleoside-diphosphate-sugar epimerase